MLQGAWGKASGSTYMPMVTPAPSNLWISNSCLCCEASSGWYVMVTVPGPGTTKSVALRRGACSRGR